MHTPTYQNQTDNANNSIPTCMIDHKIDNIYNLKMTTWYSEHHFTN
jgi:hypothetical protein